MRTLAFAISAVVVAFLIGVSFYTIPVQPLPYAYGSLPIPVGEFRLPNVLPWAPHNLPQTTTFYWMQFNFTVDPSRAYRLTGSWKANANVRIYVTQASNVLGGLVTCTEYCAPNANGTGGSLNLTVGPFAGCYYVNGTLVPGPWPEEVAIVFTSERPAIVTVTQAISVREVAGSEQPCPPQPSAQA